MSGDEVPGLLRAVQVRGLLLSGVRRHAMTRYGEAELLAALEQKSRGIARAIGGVVEGAWYPVGWLARLDEAIVEVSGAADAVQQFARETSDLAFRRFAGGASVAPTLLRPREVLERSAVLTREVMTGIRSRVVDDGEGFQLRRVDAAEPLSPLVWDHFRGAYQGVVEATGARDVRVEDVAGGEAFLEVRVSWS